MNSDKQKSKENRKEGDFWIVAVIALLTIVGLVMVYSATLYLSLDENNEDTYYYLKDDLKWMAIGWTLLIICTIIPYRFYYNLGFLALLLGFTLLALIFTPLGFTSNNATRWIKFPGLSFTIMPGEIFKTCIIFFFASFYAKDPSRIKVFFRTKRIDNFDVPCFPILTGFGVIGIGAVLIYMQPNLSTAGIVALLGVGMLFIAGLSPAWIFGLGISGVGGVYFLLSGKDNYQTKRLTSFLDPFANELNEGYQVSRSLMAFGSGGIKGVGLGKGMIKYLYLPELQNDFILSFIGEEMGFITIVFLMILYLFLIWRCFKISMACKDFYARLISFGVGLHLALQVILHTAVVSAFFPPTGVMLPFLSLGGNATVMYFIEIGVVLNISKNI